MASDRALSESSERSQRWLSVLLVLGFGAILSVPLALRLAHLSIYADDVVRIAQLQTTPLARLLFRPFNEHMAPLFEVVSWTTWQLAGRRLAHAPLAFTLAALVPFLLNVCLLRAIVLRELGSRTTALVAMALFGLTAVAIETVWWYSASSFQWALAATLGTALCVVGASTAQDRRAWVGWWTGSLLASAAAPACSAIGLLAGPFGAVIALARPGAARWRLGSLAPLAGTALYLAVCGLFRYGAVVSESVERHVDVWAGVAGAARAPIRVLVPGLLGMPHLRIGLPSGAEVAILLLAAAALLLRARRSPGRHWIWGGLVLIAGGYGMIYAFRASPAGLEAVIRVQRYHLFPLLGLVLVLAPALRARLSRYDARPLHSLAVATALAAFLLLGHRTQLESRILGYRFPDQARTLAALDRLAEICQREQITREQALAALDPIRTRWFDLPYNPLQMLGPCARAPGLPQARVRARILASLAQAEREALCGGMDATPYVRDFAGRGPRETAALGRLVKARGVQPGRGASRYLVASEPAYLEFELAGEGAGRASARALCLPGDLHGRIMEVWWTDRSRRWSETCSVRWGPVGARAGSEPAVPLECLPHWDSRRAERVRLVLRSAGPVEVEAPRLLR